MMRWIFIGLALCALQSLAAGGRLVRDHNRMLRRSSVSSRSKCSTQCPECEGKEVNTCCCPIQNDVVDDYNSNVLPVGTPLLITDEVKPENCIWTRWTEWSPCTRTCDGGKQHRSRSFIQPAQYGGHPCRGANYETQECNMNPCAIVRDCMFSDWTDWSLCSASCGEEGQQMRLRAIAYQSQNGGLDCHGPTTQTRSCEGVPCPGECKWDEFGPWSTCTVTCGGGIQSRERIALVIGDSMAQCVGASREQRECNTRGCPVDCIWTPWANWGPCSETCGGGRRHRTRGFRQEAMDGGIRCDGIHAEDEDCNQIPCPTDCIFSEWSEWSVCTQPCDTGQQSRTRSIVIPAMDGGNTCDGQTEQITDCNTEKCPTDCYWTAWSGWTDCSVSCAGGTSTRTRSRRGPKEGGKPCEGPTMESQNCNEKPCAIDCRYTLWGDWSTCTQTCGGGMKQRSRSVQRQPQHGGQPCTTETTQKTVCANLPCPVDCIFGPWSAWELCSKSCGGGERARRRVHMKPAAEGGRECVGAGTEVEACNPSPCVDTPTPPAANINVALTNTPLMCPVDGEWKAAAAGTVSNLPCPRPTPGLTRTRACTADGKWAAVDTIQCQFVATVAPPNAPPGPSCAAEGVWPVTTVGTTASLPCATGTSTRSRVCLPNGNAGLWGRADESRC